MQDAGCKIAGNYGRLWPRFRRCLKIQGRSCEIIKSQWRIVFCFNKVKNCRDLYEVEMGIDWSFGGVTTSSQSGLEVLTYSMNL